MTTINEREARYLSELRASLVSPRGFEVAVDNFEFSATEQDGRPHSMNLALAHSRSPRTSYAALTTSNRVASPSVAYLRRYGNRGIHANRGTPTNRGNLANRGTPPNRASLQTILVNNKISNVGSQSGEANFSRLQQRLAPLLRIAPHTIVPISTGIIGWTLPLKNMEERLPSLVARLGENDFVDFARSIMTTDRFAKVASRECSGGTILGACKGAGMIEPNLNTMLVFFFTDLSFSNRALRRTLRAAVSESFNRISVDGDQSTSDIVMIQSSNILPPGDERQFTAHLTELSQKLAIDVVRNGEGAGHLLKIAVTRARNRATAIGLARFIATSRLVSTAIAGNDPNVGRLVARIGQYFSTQRRARPIVRKIRISIESQIVFEKGHFILTPAIERTIADSLSSKGWDTHAIGYPILKPPVDILIDLNSGQASATMHSPDLTAEYVHINADYRS